MSFEARATTAGGMIVGGDLVTADDGLAALALLGENPEWEHLIVDVAGSVFPVKLARDAELDGLHLLARTVRDLGLTRGFRIALVRSPRTAARVADFIDLALGVVVDIEVVAFDTRDEALDWVGATIVD